MKLFNLLIWLVGIDIILTITCVGFFGATEINPLHLNFTHFIGVKVIASVIGLYALSKMEKIPLRKYCISFLTILYAAGLAFNLNEIIQNL